jgi:phosphoglycerol transferase MdoB-like AlkP superfamily enzyme
VSTGRASKQSRSRSRSGVKRAPVSPQRTYGERPPSPWHPLPLSELLILAGGVAFVIAVSRLRHGPSSGGPLLLAGIAAVGLGTIEVTWREHSSGYRSHTLLLALLPIIVLHSVVVLGYSFVAKPSEVLNVGMFAVDIILFVVLFRLLRARFLDARARATSRG